jgi:hypothetical protein
MKGMFKIALYSAPILGLVLILVMGRLDKHDAQMEFEKAQFDKEWAHNNQEFDKAFSDSNSKKEGGEKVEAKEGKNTFWAEQKREAEERLIEAKKRLAVTRGKVEAAGRAAEEAMQEMDNSFQAGSKPGKK